jgi:hypothetical protein
MTERPRRGRTGRAADALNPNGAGFVSTVVPWVVTHGYSH